MNATADPHRIAELIRQEHLELKSMVGQLHSVCPCAQSRRDCSACETSKAAGCEQAVARILEEVFVFMVDHFRKEEMAMRQHRLDLLDRPACEGHREAHAEITEHARHLIADLSPHSVLSNVHDLAGLLDGWIGDHVADHDHRLLGLLGVEHHEPGAVARASAN